MNIKAYSHHALKITGTVGLLALLSACATGGIAPVAQLAATRASIAQAESAGALQAAPVELLSSRDKLSKAEAAVRAEQFDQAQRFAEQAEADAELAERKARAVNAQAAADELARSNEALQKEVDRKSGR